MTAVRRLYDRAYLLLSAIAVAFSFVWPILVTELRGVWL